MAETIAFVLRNLPVFLFVAALVFAWLSRSGAPLADRLLAWILLLPICVTGLWAAVFHLFFPEVAAADIGWEPSPFQFEVGMADLAMGAPDRLSHANTSAATNRNTGRLRRTKAIVSAIMGS